MEKDNETEKKKIYDRLVEKRLNGCADLYAAEEKEQEKSKEALNQIHEALIILEELMYG